MTAAELERLVHPERLGDEDHATVRSEGLCQDIHEQPRLVPNEKHTDPALGLPSHMFNRARALYPIPRRLDLQAGRSGANARQELLAGQALAGQRLPSRPTPRDPSPGLPAREWRPRRRGCLPRRPLPGTSSITSEIDAYTAVFVEDRHHAATVNLVFHEDPHA